MKKIFLYSALTFLTQSVNATIWLVDNNPNSPQPITDVQIAINDSASAGDTIMVEGSSIGYGNLVISKSIVLIGEGYNEPQNQNVVFNSIDLQTSNIYLTGVRTDLLTFNGTIAVNDSLYNILVERCYLKQLGFTGKDNNSGLYSYLGNLIIRNNIINGSSGAGGAFCYFFGNNVNFHRMNFDTLIFENNIFSFFRFSIAAPYHLLGMNTLLIKNNLFIDDVPYNPSSTLFYYAAYLASMEDAIISNNIFYGTNPQGCSNCTYFNNLTYQNGVNDTLPPPLNGNIYSQDPLFVNYSGGAFDFSHDYHLQQLPFPSPAIGTGIPVGTDIGIYGGAFPFNVGQGPKVPVVGYVNVSGTALPQGGSFFLQFDARIRK